MKTPVELSLIDSIDNDAIKDLLVDHGEIVLDQLINDEALKQIPIIGSVTSIFKLGLSFRDYIFSKKIIRFLYKLSDVSLEERQRFTIEINNTPDFKAKVGTKLLLLLDKFDEIDKAELLAKAFESYIKTVIDYKTFCLLTIAIDRFALILKSDFIIFYSITKSPLDAVFADHIFNCGLLSTKTTYEINSNTPRGTPAGTFKKNELGYLFYEHVLEGKSFKVKDYLINMLLQLKIHPVREHPSYDVKRYLHDDLIEIIKKSEIADSKSISLNLNEISIPEGIICRDTPESFYMLIAKTKTL